MDEMPEQSVQELDIDEEGHQNLVRFFNLLIEIDKSHLPNKPYEKSSI
jgi:hypothetical protein